MRLIILIYFWLLFFCQSSLGRPEIVDIGNVIRELKSSTSCNLKDWGDISSSCRCCLVKHNLKGQSDTANINDCIKNKHCTETVLTDLGGSQARGDLVANVTKEALVAKDLTVPGLKKQLDQSTVVDILQKAESEGLIDPLGKSCIRTIQLEINSWYAAQLFLVQLSPTCQEKDYRTGYVLKGLKSPLKEIKNLAIVKKSNLISNKIKDLVITDMVFAASYLSGSSRQYIVLVEAAKGKSLRDLIKDAAKFADYDIKNATEHKKYIDSLEKIRKAYRKFGEVTADLHISNQERCSNKILCNTIIHGDLHYENVFYDESSNKIYLIDNESFANSIIKKANPANDLTRFYYFSAAIIKKSLRFPTEMSDAVLAATTLEPFLQGYLSRFLPSQKERVKTEIKEALLRNAVDILIEYKAGKPQVYDPVKLAQLQKELVEDIINKL